MSPTSLSWFFLISLITVIQADSSKKCVLQGDPHIHTFHDSTNAQGGSWKNCYGNHILTILENSYMRVRAQVADTHIINQVEFEFFDPSNSMPICYISSNSFHMSHLGNCSTGTITLKDNSTKQIYSLTITDHRAQAVISLTHDRGNPTRHYNMIIWMSSSLSAVDQGTCRVAGCPGSQGPGKRSIRSVLNPNNLTLTNQTIGLVCDTYIDAYLNSVARPESQRNSAYNETIRAAREYCRVDGNLVGIELATSYLEGLMIEELTSGIDNMTVLSETLVNNIDQAITNWETIVNQTSVVVNRILDEVFLNRTTTTTTSRSTTTVTTTPITTVNVTSNTTRITNTTMSSSSSKTYSPLVLILTMLIFNRFLKPVGFFSFNE